MDTVGQGWDDVPDRAKQLVDLLLGEVYTGLMYSYCAESLLGAFRGSELFRMSYFFNTIFDASYLGALLGLSRLVVEQKDSITMHYLFNFAESNPKLFSPTSPDRVVESVKGHRQQLQAHKQLFDRVRQRRDRTLAHLDRMHVTNPADLFEHPEPVDVDELIRCFWDIFDIVNVYAGFLGQVVKPQSLQRAVQGDIDILVEWMAKYGRREDWIREHVFD